MASLIGQGQSELATEAKVRGIAYALSINLAIFKAKFASSPFRYWHFDLNAGSGFNDKIGCIGSPLTFLAQARAIGLERYFAGFCDIDRDAVSALLRRPEVDGDPNAFVFHGDNGGLCGAIPDLISAMRDRPEMALGSVLSDDNATGIPVSQLATLAQRCPRLDIIIHWNSTAFKRVRTAYPERPTFTLPEVVAAIHKPHWWIREPVSMHQFTLLVARGIDKSPPAALGFHRIGTSRGDDILSRCALTRDEYQQTGPLQNRLF